MRRLTVNGAANGLGSSENFEHGALELLSKTLGAHRPCDLNDLVEGDVAGMLDVLLLLPVTRGLLESANDEGRGGGDNGDSSLTVLDGELDGYAKTLPRGGRFCDIFTDLFGRL